MDITWYGQTCFRLRNRKVTVVTDPTQTMFSGNMSRLKADIFTLSIPTKVKSNPTEGVQVIDSPGEYEIADVFVTSVYMPPTKAVTSDDILRNNLFVVYIEDVAVCHLGYLGYIPSQSQIETLGNIDILLVPIGGGTTLNVGQASEIINLIEPQLVVPMCYQLTTLPFDDYITPKKMDELESVEKFLKEMGLTNVQTTDMLKISKTQLPEETQVVLLEPKTV